MLSWFLQWLQSIHNVDFYDYFVLGEKAIVHGWKIQWLSWMNIHWKIFRSLIFFGWHITAESPYFLIVFSEYTHVRRFLELLQKSARIMEWDCSKSGGIFCSKLMKILSYFFSLNIHHVLYILEHSLKVKRVPQSVRSLLCSNYHLSVSI